METNRQQMIRHLEDCDRNAGRRLVEVAGAANVAAVLQGTTSPPSVYIVRNGNTRQDNGRTLTISDQFWLLIAVRNVRDARGNDASDEAERWSQTIEGWLKPWRPVFAAAEQFESLKLLGGVAHAWTDQVLIWRDNYQLTYLRRCC